jgi:hypothetical protein
MRRIGLLTLVLVTACAPPGPENRFRNPATGEVVAACGPYIGLASAAKEAEQGCTEAYEEQGWVRLPASK